MAKILVIDDERLARVLAREACSRLGHEVLEADCLASGMEKATSGVDLVLLDVMLPDGDGLSQVENFSNMPGSPAILIVTGHGHEEGAAEALHSGALDYLSKPLQLKDITRVVGTALAWRAQRRRKADSLNCPEIIGKSKALQEVFEKMAEAAASDVNVLILGETGVGKELVAGALHRNSLRRNKPCITLDCASLPSTLLSAQLFGHAKGAFTGADRSREGLLRAAHMGTLFLDEVGELPLDVQGSFLRALDIRRFRPVGEKEEVESDFRLISATNKDLSQMSKEGSYRSDLLYRLQGMSIVLPPLRKRLEDLPLLVDHFLGQWARKSGRNAKLPTPDFIDALRSYFWPGNVRELHHVVQSAVIAAGEMEELHVHNLPQDVRIAISRQKFRNTLPSQPLPLSGDEPVLVEAPAAPKSPAAARPPMRSSAFPPLKQCRNEAEASYLEELLTHTGRDMTLAAKLAGVSRGHFYELLHKHGKG